MKTPEETIDYLEKRIKESEEWITKHKDTVYYTMIENEYARIGELKATIDYIKYGI